MDQKILNILKAALKSHELLNDDRFSNIVIFTTQRDNKVDDFICLPLAGNEYGIDDPNRPRIPEDTHPNCMKLLLIYLVRELMSMKNNLAQ